MHAENTDSFDSLSISLSISLSHHPSLDTFSPLLLTTPLEVIQCPHRAKKCKFLLVGQPRPVHV